jgi:Lar family restriction alleviation protein
MEELKPCPFCGGKAVFDTVSQGAGNPRGFVRCENRCCEMCWISSKYEAIEAWNRRVHNG